MSVKCKHGKPVYQGCVDCPPDGLTGMKAENERLKAINAELLALLKKVYVAGATCFEFDGEVYDELDDAIANAQPPGGRDGITD